MYDSVQVAQTASSVFGVLLSIGLNIALLVVALAARKRRPDVGPWLLAAAVAALVLAVLIPLLSTVASFVAARYSIEATLWVHAIGSVVSALVNGAAFMLLLVAISRLSKPSPAG